MGSGSLAYQCVTLGVLVVISYTLMTLLKISFEFLREETGGAMFSNRLCSSSGHDPAWDTC